VTRPTEGPLHLVKSGRGPVVVLVHGVVGSHLIWDHLVPFLEQQYTVVRIDLMGYGSSPSPVAACSADTHVEAIRRSLGDAQVLPPYTLIGLSMGANLALTYAARWPGEVCDFVGIGLPYFATETDARAGLSHNLWTGLTIRRPRLAAVAIPASCWAIRHSGLTRLHRGIYTPAMAYDALRVDFPAFRSTVFSCMLHYPFDASLAASATMRRLFIHGSEDKWSGVDVVRKALAPFPQTRFEVIDGEPHNVVVTAPVETARLLFEHLAPHHAT
jgi:pimeloyl-ACP methyl ester carboxylesterase